MCWLCILLTCISFALYIDNAMAGIDVITTRYHRARSVFLSLREARAPRLELQKTLSDILAAAWPGTCPWPKIEVCASRRRGMTGTWWKPFASPPCDASSSATWPMQLCMTPSLAGSLPYAKTNDTFSMSELGGIESQNRLARRLLASTRRNNDNMDMMQTWSGAFQRRRSKKNLGMLPIEIKLRFRQIVWAKKTELPDHILRDARTETTHQRGRTALASPCAKQFRDNIESVTGFDEKD